jgi:hypothetical protein
MYRPQSPFNAALSLLIPTYSNSVGVEAKTFPNAQNGLMFYGSFRTFGGTERDINGVYSVEKTAVVETWFRPDIKSDCRIVVLQTGEIYEILGEPENIELRNQYLKFKVRQVKGGA